MTITKESAIQHHTSFAIFACYRPPNSGRSALDGIESRDFWDVQPQEESEVC